MLSKHVITARCHNNFRKRWKTKRLIVLRVIVIETFFIPSGKCKYLDRWKSTLGKTLIVHHHRSRSYILIWIIRVLIVYTLLYHKTHNIILSGAAKDEKVVSQIIWRSEKGIITISIVGNKKALQSSKPLLTAQYWRFYFKMFQ